MFFIFHRLFKKLQIRAMDFLCKKIFPIVMPLQHKFSNLKNLGYYLAQPASKIVSFEGPLLCTCLSETHGSHRWRSSSSGVVAKRQDNLLAASGRCHGLHADLGCRVLPSEVMEGHKSDEVTGYQGGRTKNQIHILFFFFPSIFTYKCLKQAKNCRQKCLVSLIQRKRWVRKAKIQRFGE